MPQEGCLFFTMKPRWRVSLLLMMVQTAIVTMATSNHSNACDICVCDSTNEHVNCTAKIRNQSETIFLPNTTTYLLFDSNNLTVIPSYIFGAPNLRFLSVRYNNIIEIGNGTQLCRGNNLQHLYVDSNRISSIFAETFKDCNNLMTLSLRKNLLTIDLIASVLPYLPKLSSLDCSFNQFGTPTSLPQEFQTVSQLLSLSLEYMHLQSIPSNFFTHLNASNFHQLSLADNLLLKVAPEAFSNLTKLGMLDISYTGTQLLNVFNHTLSLFSVIKNSDDLYRIDMRQNFIFDEIEEFDSNRLFKELENNSIRILHMEENPLGFKGILHRMFLAPLRHLEELYLDHNEITTIHHNALVKNHKLKILSLKDNYLSCKTDCPFASMTSPLQQLQTLDLSQNVIDNNAGYLAFQSEIFPQLKHLNLRNNRLTKVSGDWFMGTYTLRTLDLSENPIERIERESFVTLSHLTRLVIEECLNLKELPIMAFSGLSGLVELRLSRNRITTVHAETWVGLDSLQHFDLSYNELGGNVLEMTIPSPNVSSIDLSYNNLELIPHGLIQYTTALKILTLSHNRISVLEKKYFQNLTSLTRLDLSYNALTWINVDVLDQIVLTLHWLDISGNPLFCNCNSEGIITWLRTNKDILAHDRNTKCFGPSKEVDELLLNYTPSDQCKTRATTNLQVVLMATAFAILTAFVAVISIIYFSKWRRRRRLCAKLVSAPATANEINVSTTCTNKQETEFNSGSASSSSHSDNSESATSFLMKCMPLDLFRRQTSILSENGHIDAPLMENLYESDANI